MTADEELRLWPELDARYGEISRYRARSVRRILIIVLEPREADGGD